jgi:hypothetical protein
MILGAQNKFIHQLYTDLIEYYWCTYVQVSQIRHGITLRIRYRNGERFMLALLENPVLAVVQA